MQAELVAMAVGTSQTEADPLPRCPFPSSAASCFIKQILINSLTLQARLPFLAGWVSLHRVLSRSWHQAGTCGSQVRWG